LTGNSRPKSSLQSRLEGKRPAHDWSGAQDLDVGGGRISVSIDTVLGSSPKCLFTILQNAHFTGSADAKPYFFKHLNLSFRHVREWAIGKLRRPLITRPVPRLVRWPIRRSSAISGYTSGRRVSRSCRPVHERNVHSHL
jgi:hypothetical protein